MGDLCRWNSPLVSCITPTYNRRSFVPQAIRYFQAQDYPNKELILLDDGSDSVADLVPSDPRIRYLRQERKSTVGAKRNLACTEAQGEIIVHWDDDDWMSENRLSYQVKSLIEEQADICGLNKVLFLNSTSDRCWEYIYSNTSRPWVHGATLCYTKAFWRASPFPDINVGEDSRFVWSSRTAKILTLQDSTFLVALVHPGNISPKQAGGSNWHAYPIEKVRELMRADWAFYADLSLEKKRGELTKSSPLALVSAASGIGDIVRITPLIRVLARLGYQVDVLVAPDYPDTIKLLEGAPEIRRLYCYANFKSNKGQEPLPGLDQEYYDVATFTVWSSPLQRWVRARRTLVFPHSQWLREGDIACATKIAHEVGWNGPLPEAFIIPSQKKFNLPPGTIALHPGCKPHWPWKKWHGFEELAQLLPNVVIIGSESDLDNSQTYFRKTFEWPAHAQSFVGQLNLSDTAALLKQCAALVSNDSGLMHLGMALGIPTFGIFGITSPQREVIPSRWMFPITKGLPCEQACRQKPWGRRDCERHLECLKTLTVDEVVAQIEEKLPSLRYSTSARRRDEHMETISLNYYGYVFDATGYGQAARAYIHALHAARVKVSVVNIGAQPQQVQDELVASLLGKNPDADFHLFHGIPVQWAHLAYPLRNVIAMTVWETSTMPQRWRNPLTHSLDVWLPCNFNMGVFSRDLGRPTFRLPHPTPPSWINGAHYAPLELERLGLRGDDFVFYSIFEWQDRKNPRGMIKGFFQAFPEDGPPVLLLKTNPGALTAARHTLDAVRTETSSRSRVVLCCKAWTDAQLQMLHNRGDCYVSLHKGEGWGYPLFEAACRGKPVVATAFSGPLDYLDDEHHTLVRYREASVQQSYAYYHPSMRWSEPDLAHASEAMKRVYEQREQARARAQEGAAALTATYSIEAIGSAARGRLMTLLKRSNPGKWDALDRRERAKRASPALPIPGEWYDADYFEHGLKSNWDQGYTWPLFQGLFSETAEYLTKMFPEAQSFLDAGCAKGFLVRALFEQGKEAFGFDHSAWAVERAESAARPFLSLGDFGTVAYDRPFDVLVAMSLLESLTEEQIRAFLPRARGWARQALFATIPTISPESGLSHTWNDRDLSHVTLRDRAWWRERFLEAGWRQDPLHRIVERACQSHPLSQKMGWSVYVFAPGS